MPTTEAEVTRLYKKMLIPLGVTYAAFIESDRYPPPGSKEPKPDPDIPNQFKRQFSQIALAFGKIPRQIGAFMGDSEGDKMKWKFYTLNGNKLDQSAVVLDVDAINDYDSTINTDGVCLLIAHELAHGFRWYMGHPGGDSGYQNEPWARTLELAYVEALQNKNYAGDFGVTFERTVQFIKLHRKKLYKSTENEKKFYIELTEDDKWEFEPPPSSRRLCPVCNIPLKVPRHQDCKP
jgi:hypothetical protein